MFKMTYLLCRNAKTGKWTPEFADSSAAVVRREKRDSYNREQLKDLGFDKAVICTTYSDTLESLYAHESIKRGHIADALRSVDKRDGRLS